MNGSMNAARQIMNRRTKGSLRNMQLHVEHDASSASRSSRVTCDGEHRTNHAWCLASSWGVGCSSFRCNGVCMNGGHVPAADDRPEAALPVVRPDDTRRCTSVFETKKSWVCGQEVFGSVAKLQVYIKATVQKRRWRWKLTVANAALLFWIGRG